MTIARAAFTTDRRARAKEGRFIRGRLRRFRRLRLLRDTARAAERHVDGAACVRAGRDLLDSRRGDLMIDTRGRVNDFGHGLVFAGAFVAQQSVLKRCRQLALRRLVHGDFERGADFGQAGHIRVRHIGIGGFRRRWTIRISQGLRRKPSRSQNAGREHAYKRSSAHDTHLIGCQTLKTGEVGAQDNSPKNQNKRSPMRTVSPGCTGVVVVNG